MAKIYIYLKQSKNVESSMKTKNNTSDLKKTSKSSYTIYKKFKT